MGILWYITVISWSRSMYDLVYGFRDLGVQGFTGLGT